MCPVSKKNTANKLLQKPKGPSPFHTFYPPLYTVKDQASPVPGLCVTAAIRKFYDFFCDSLYGQIALAALASTTRLTAIR